MDVNEMYTLHVVLVSEPWGGSYRMFLTDGNRFTLWTIHLKVILRSFVCLVGWLAGWLAGCLQSLCALGRCQVWQVSTQVSCHVFELFGVKNVERP